MDEPRLRFRLDAVVPPRGPGTLVWDEIQIIWTDAGPTLASPSSAKASLRSSNASTTELREHDQLARRPPVFHVGVRPGDLVERIRAVDRDREPARGDRVEVGLEHFGGK